MTNDQDTNMFATEPTEEVATPSPASPSFVDQLSEIKNENGEPKYKSVEDAIKALANSQAFIPQLLSEKKQLEEEINVLREKAKKVDNIDDVLAKLSATNVEATKQNEATTQNSGLNEEAVVNLVKKALNQTKAEEAQKSNITRVQNSLKEKFGDKANEIVKKKAAELNTTPEAIGQLAVDSPDLVLALFNTTSFKPVLPSVSSVNLPSNPAAIVLEPPKKSLLLGATSREQTDYMKQVKAEVYRKFNVTE